MADDIEKLRAEADAATERLATAQAGIAVRVAALELERDDLAATIRPTEDRIRELNQQIARLRGTKQAPAPEASGE